jgi:cellulose synthase/poly-beta-1,6-N-acetylglucosamine synthase-like glycosyltransferase
MQRQSATMPIDALAEQDIARRVAGSAVRFWWLFALVATLLAVVIAGAFLLPQPWSWLIGLLYIGYETWLTVLVFVRSRRAVLEELDQSPAVTDGSGPTLAVLIAARDERLALPATLAPLAAQLRDGDEILVIDDGSRDGSISWIEADYALAWDGIWAAAAPGRHCACCARQTAARRAHLMPVWR